jgi:hypothetical protein
MVLLNEEAGKASFLAGKTSLAIEILNLCDARSFCLKFRVYISHRRRLPRQQFAALRTFRLGFIEWSVSPAYTQNSLKASIFLIGKLEDYEKARNALKVNHPHCC